MGEDQEKPTKNNEEDGRKPRNISKFYAFYIKKRPQPFPLENLETALFNRPPKAKTSNEVKDSFQSNEG